MVLLPAVSAAPCTECPLPTTATAGATDESDCTLSPTAVAMITGVTLLLVAIVGGYLLIRLIEEQVHGQAGGTAAGESDGTHVSSDKA